MKRRMLAFVLVLSQYAVAHDFWIEPSTFRPPVGSVVNVALRVGEDFKGEPVKREAAKIEKFAAITPTGEKPIAGMEGAEPAGLLKVEAAGLHVLGYHGKPRSIELSATQFEEYLQGEGLESIIGLRRERGESDKPGREIYSRCAKALIVAQGKQRPTDSVEANVKLGMPLELIADTNPYQSPAPTQFRVRLLFNGQPLAGAKVGLVSEDSPKETVYVRTSADGSAAFAWPKGGTILVKTVHMVRAQSGADADWESFWATLTFDAVAPASTP